RRPAPAAVAAGLDSAAAAVPGRTRLAPLLRLAADPQLRPDDEGERARVARADPVQPVLPRRGYGWPRQRDHLARHGDPGRLLAADPLPGQEADDEVRDRGARVREHGCALAAARAAQGDRERE